MNAFDIPAVSCFASEHVKPAYPQLTYYHRAMKAGTHPRKLRSQGLEVLDRRFKANKARSTSRAND